MTKVIVAILSSILLTACANMQPVNNEKMELAASTTPTCIDARECELKWAAARKWVLENAAYRLQTVTDDYLETFPPRRNHPLLAARVSKEPMKSGGYRIVANLYCANMFGCTPDRGDATLDFNRAVTAASQ